MTRSNYSEKFLPKTVYDYCKKFKDKYKRENGEQFTGNVLDYITYGVIERKGLPDVEDVVTLVVISNNNCSEDVAFEKITNGLQVETLSDIFCKLCSDLTLDIPLHPRKVEVLKNLNDYIDKYIDRADKFNDFMNSLKSLKNISKPTNVDKVAAEG